MEDVSQLTKALWAYNVALCCNEKAVKKGDCDHLEWVADKREETAKTLLEFVPDNFAQCSVSFLAAYYHWADTFEVYTSALSRVRNSGSRSDWLALERAVAVIFFHQGFVRYKQLNGDRYFQLCLTVKKGEEQEWQYLRQEKRC